MHLINKCSPIWSIRLKDGYNLSITRKLIMAELFLLFLIYFIIEVVLQRKLWQLQLLTEKQQRQAQEKKQSQRYQNFKSCFMQSFGEHAVAAGFIMCFSPYTFETSICMLHLLLFCFAHYKRMRGNESHVTNMLIKIINLTLLLCGMLGISRCRQTQEGCQDSMYQWDNRIV